jgi:hypothetical protein
LERNFFCSCKDWIRGSLGLLKEKPVHPVRVVSGEFDLCRFPYEPAPAPGILGQDIDAVQQGTTEKAIIKTVTA